MTTERARQLTKLAGQLPGANQQVQQGLQEGRKTQLQATLQQIQPGASGTKASQILGQQQAQQAGQIATQGMQQQQNQSLQMGQLGLQEQAKQQRSKSFSQQLSLTEQQGEISRKLGRIDSKLKDRLLDQQLQFREDQSGQTLLNETQLMDWAIQKSESEEELKSYMQNANQVHSRKSQMINQAYSVVSRAIETGYLANKKKLDNESRKKLMVMQREAQLQKEKEASRARNRRAQNNAIGQVLGAVIGVVAVVASGVGTGGGSTVASPAIYAAGAGVGMQIGGAIANSQD